MIEIFKTILYYPFLNLLTFYTWLVPGHHIVWGIILLTLTVRFALLIPTKRQAQSQRKTMQLAPLIEDLKKEYGDDRQGLAMAQMELYKKNGINPFGSCLLGLVQLPILLVLYYAILNGLNADSPHLYSWLPRPDHITTSFFGLDLLKPDPTYILPIIAAGLQFLQMKLTIPKFVKGQAVDPAIAMQRNMVYIFPALTLFIAGSFPAGVAVYWIVSTSFSVVQQYFVNKEKFNIQGVEQVMNEADKQHPEYKRPEKVEQKILKEAAVTKKGVTVTVRKKSK